MKNRLASLAASIRNSRRAKVLAILFTCWVAIMVGIVIVAFKTAKPYHGVTLRPAAASKRHPKVAAKKIPARTSASNNASPCPIKDTSSERPTSSVNTPAPREQAPNTVTQAPSENRGLQYRDETRTDIPPVPYRESNRAPAVLWASFPSSSRIGNRVAVQTTASSLSTAAVRSVDTGRRPSQNQLNLSQAQLNTGRQTAGSEWKHFGSR